MSCNSESPYRVSENSRIPNLPNRTLLVESIGSRQFWSICTSLEKLRSC